MRQPHDGALLGPLTPRAKRARRNVRWDDATLGTMIPAALSDELEGTVYAGAGGCAIASTRKRPPDFAKLR